MDRSRSSYAKQRKIPHIDPPLQQRLYWTTKEFGTDYGLSLISLHPHKLPSNIYEEQWLIVFMCPVPKYDQRVKSMSIRPHLYEFFLLHYKVYQETPTNNGVGLWFAKGFALEHCVAVANANHISPYAVAWATYVEFVMQTVAYQANITPKMNCWSKVMDHWCKLTSLTPPPPPLSNSLFPVDSLVMWYMSSHLHDERITSLTFEM